VMEFIPKLITLINEKRFQEAYQLCATGGRRTLPRVMGAALDRAINCPPLIKSAMEEEMLHMVPILERRLPAVAAIGSIATLLGLMGTIYGLILAFAAVGRPDVQPAEKASMLAMGISAAMNTTLLGLLIAIPCVFFYAMLRAKVDAAIADIDRYAVSLLKVLLPSDTTQKSYKVSGRRIKEELDTEPNIVPFMNLMVVLIPLLLSSSEFVKMGMIELKLPEAAGAGGGAGGEVQDVKLNLGIVITGKGFQLFHAFKQEVKPPAGAPAVDPATLPPEIPLVDGQFDYAALNAKLAEVKRQALLAILRTVDSSVPATSTLEQLWDVYRGQSIARPPVYADHEDLKIVAEDSVKYQVVVATMDAARGFVGKAGNVTMFPNVSIAGGIAY